VPNEGKVHVHRGIGDDMAISLMQTLSPTGDLVFTIKGDLPEKSYRGEGRFVVELLNQQCVIENNKQYFVNGFDLTNGRGLLAALFIFHPTWNALGSYKEMIHMGFEPSKEITTVRTNMDCPKEMLELLQNDWMLPNLRFEFISEHKTVSLTTKTPLKPSLAFGGGLDSGAAISLLEHSVDSFYITNSSPCDVRLGIGEILEMFSGHVIHTNVKTLYSVTGFPHWMIPYIPSMVRGDDFCLTGSILESQYLRDGYGYNNSTGNLWVKMLKMAGVEALPLSCHSEYTNAYIVAKSGLSELIAGNCTDEWGFGFKALRKAVLLRPFDEYYEEILLSIEERGFVIDPKLKFSQPSKMLTSTSKSAILTSSQSASQSIQNLKKFGHHSNLPWAFKFHPDNFSMHNWPDEILAPIHHSQEKFGIHPMNEKDIDMLKSYEHESFLVENYSAEFLASLN
tara:strand:+ start:1127 stop:2482 length:1356 start_codon:yes stop_codon:yes gene_type:complete